MSQLTTSSGFSGGDGSQTNRAPDWLAPNLLVQPAAQRPPSYHLDPGTSATGTEQPIQFSRCTAYAIQLTPAVTRPPGRWTNWDLSRTLVESQAFAKPIPITQTTPIPLASYLLLIDHYLPGGYAPAGTTITEGGPYIPFGWTPTLAVDPLNSTAIRAFWNAGPLPLDAESYRDQYQPGIPLFRKPQVYWTQTSPGTYILTGAGATLGAKSSG